MDSSEEFERFETSQSLGSSASAHGISSNSTVESTTGGVVIH